MLDFYNQRRAQLVKSKPNKGHYKLAELEQFFDIQIITQNVDNLHEQAGSTNVLHLHGELMKVRSTGPGSEIYDLSTTNFESHIGDKCTKSFHLRPHIVWFGEAVPEMEKAIQMAKTAEIFVVIGTSLQVYPAAGLIHYAPAGIPLYYIDPQKITHLSSKVSHIQKTASVGIVDLIKKLVK